MLVVRALLIGVALGSPAHAQPEAISFLEAIRRAKLQNPEVLVAAAEIQRAGAVVEQVRAGSLPKLTATALFTQLDAQRHSVVNPDRVILPQSALLLSGSATLPVEPQRWVQWAQARAGARVFQLSAAQVQRNIAIAIGQVYLSLMAQHQIVSASLVAVRNGAAHAEYSRTRLDAGAGTLLDHERAEALLENERAQLESAQLRVTRLQEQLGILAGENAPLDTLETWGLPALPAEATVALDDAMRLRPDLRVARATWALATEVRRQSWADYLPYANIVFMPFYETPPTQRYPTTGWQLFVTAQFDLYDGGQRYGVLAERRALEREAHIRLDAELRLVRAEVRTAAVEVGRTAVALRAARASATLWAEALRLALISYRSGLTTNIDVIDAQTASFNADVQAALAENDARQAELDLLTASGRFP